MKLKNIAGMVVRAKGFPYLDKLQKRDNNFTDWFYCKLCKECRRGVCSCRNDGSTVIPLGYRAFEGLI
jgi:hypothetical protein